MEHFWVATIGKHDTNDLGETIASDDVDYISAANLLRTTKARLRKDQAEDDDQTVVVWEVREVARYKSTRSVVHGGITFSGHCQHGKDPSRGICHIPAPGEPDNVFWFGFDCSHAGDASPSDFIKRPSEHRSFGEKMQTEYGYEYRDIEYVRGEIRELAQQLHDYKPGPTEIEA